MALQPEAVRVAGTGEIFVSAESTTMPPIATVPPGVTWTGLGLTTTDGCDFTFSRDTNDIDAWQQSKVRVVTNKEPATVKFTLLETDAATLPIVFGGGTVTTTGTAPDQTSTFEPPAEGTNTVRALLVRFTDDTINTQYYFPRAQIDGDVTFKLSRTDAIGYAMSFGILGSTPRWTMETDDPNVVTGP